MKRTTSPDENRKGNGALLEGVLTWKIIGSFYRVYDALGFGFLESVYRRAMILELAEQGLSADAEAAVDVWYRGIQIGHFRTDLLVAGKVIVEIKASETLPASGRRQLLNYLRGSKLEVGLLLHFGPKAAFQRVIYTNENKVCRSGTQ